MRNSILFFVLGSTILSITACKKDTVSMSNPVPFKIEREHIPPTANAGGEVFVFLPADSCILYASGSHDTYSTVSNTWRKISGPSSFKISNSGSSGTRVNDLVKGVYEFELTVTDNWGLSDVDTMSVIVGEMSTREAFIKNNRWNTDGLMWGCDLTVKNIYSFIPVGSVFKVFISSENSGGWVETIYSRSSGSENAQYLLYVRDSNLGIFTNYLEGGVADLKIVY